MNIWICEYSMGIRIWILDLQYVHLLPPDTGECQHVKLHLRLPRLRGFARGCKLVRGGLPAKQGQGKGGRAASQKCLSNIPNRVQRAHSVLHVRTPQWFLRVKFDLGEVYSACNKSGTTCSFSTRAILQLPVTLFFHIKAGIKDDQVDLCLFILSDYALQVQGYNHKCRCRAVPAQG